MTSLRDVQGWTAIAGCRQFFYARYADYAITMPLIILQLGLVAGADGAMIAATIGADSKSCRVQPGRLHALCVPRGSVRSLALLPAF